MACTLGVRTKGCGWGLESRCCPVRMTTWVNVENVMSSEQSKLLKVCHLQKRHKPAEQCSLLLVHSHKCIKWAKGMHGNEESHIQDVGGGEGGLQEGRCTSASPLSARIRSFLICTEVDTHTVRV